MTDTIAPPAPRQPKSQRTTPEFPIGDPVGTAWREDVLTRAKELASIRAYLLECTSADAAEPFWAAIGDHLEAVRQAAEGRKGRKGRRARAARIWSSITGSTLGRAMSNLDAAEANLLRVAPDYYLAGQMPSLLNHVQRHLEPDDARRRELERIAARFGPDQPASANTDMALITPRSAPPSSAASAPPARPPCASSCGCAASATSCWSPRW
jgi:hypothetical protein